MMQRFIQIMQRSIQMMLLGIVGGVLFWGSVQLPVHAADLAQGAQVFAANCIACHANGNNVVNTAKTLKMSDLQQYEMASIEAIKQQVTKGKMAMPAFQGRLTDAEIESVAAYVLDQADKGW